MAAYILSPRGRKHIRAFTRPRPQSAQSGAQLPDLLAQIMRRVVGGKRLRTAALHVIDCLLEAICALERPMPRRRFPVFRISLIVARRIGLTLGRSATQVVARDGPEQTHCNRQNVLLSAVGVDHVLGGLPSAAGSIGFAAAQSVTSVRR